MGLPRSGKRSRLLMTRDPVMLNIRTTVIGGHLAFQMRRSGRRSQSGWRQLAGIKIGRGAGLGVGARESGNCRTTGRGFGVATTGACAMLAVAS